MSPTASDVILDQFKKERECDEELQALKMCGIHGWPSSEHSYFKTLQLYFTFKGKDFIYTWSFIQGSALNCTPRSQH